MTPAPHPRFRSRRIEVRREEGRRRRFRLALVLSILAFVAVAVAIVRSPVLDVDAVRISGTVRTTPQEVRAAAGIRPGSAMIDVDPGAVARRVEARPWVAEASVHRHWPSTVEVEVTERRPVAQARNGDTWSALDRSGRVLARLDAPDPGLVVVAGITPGPPGSSVGTEDGLVLASALSARLGADAGSIAQGSEGLELELRDGIAVRFGSVDALDEKLFALHAILTKARRDPPIATIDVRVPSAPVLTRKADDA